MSVKSLPRDTTREVQQKQFELMRLLPGWKRLTLAFELTHAVRELTLADIRHRFPDASEDEIRRKFIARVLPRNDVIRAFNFDPKEEDMGCG